MNKNILWACVIQNSICIICWTALAIVFNKWWIAFFSVLFMSSSPVQYYYRYCDNCGKHGPYANSYNEALKRPKKQVGFIVRTAIKITVQNVSKKFLRSR